MERNWIEEIREFIRKAMNKGFRIKSYHILLDDNKNYYDIRVSKDDLVIKFAIDSSKIRLETSKGEACFDVTLSKRDFLDLDTIMLSVEEYNEDMAISEFEEFISDKKEKITSINDLDNDEE